MNTQKFDNGNTDFDEDGTEQEGSPREAQIHPFDPTKIKVSTAPAPIATVVTRIKESEIDLAPAFQRKARLWSSENKSRLIESILLKIPLPIFYVAADKDDNWAVVDGIQRLTTIYDFCMNTFSLSDLEYLTSYNNFYFKDLPRPMQRRIQETALTVNIIQDGTPDEVMMNIFKRINTGGLALKAQEIRNALYKEKARPFFTRLVEMKEFKAAHNNSINDERMGGQELILRFFAFYLHPWQEYRQYAGLDRLLDQTMSEINEKSETELRNLELVFCSAMKAAHTIFGKYAFRKTLNSGAARSRLNKALFESISVYLARQSSRKLSTLYAHKKTIQDKLDALLKDEDFSDAISSSTGSVNRVNLRFDRIEQLFASIKK